MAGYLQELIVKFYSWADYASLGAEDRAALAQLVGGTDAYQWDSGHLTLAYDQTDDNSETTVYLNRCDDFVEAETTVPGLSPSEITTGIQDEEQLRAIALLLGKLFAFLRAADSQGTAETWCGLVSEFE